MTADHEALPSSTDPPLELRSWHDNAVHALRLSDSNPEEGTSTLTLDIDHIIEWIQDAGAFQFRIAPALLRFYGVFALKVHLDYSVGPIAVTPFQIHGIEHRYVDTPYARLRYWRIPLNSPKGELGFQAADWSLTFSGPARLSKCQVLTRPTPNLI